MRLRFPIPARLLAGFLANLALLALAFWLLFQAQFEGVSNQVFANVAEPRVQAVVERVVGELRAEPQTGWDRVLANHSKAEDVEFAIYDGDMRSMAGPRQDLPEELMVKMVALTPHVINRGPSGGGPPGGRPPAPEDFLFGDFGLPRSPPPPPPRKKGSSSQRDSSPLFEGGPEPVPLDAQITDYPKVTAHTSNPSAYWVVTRVPVWKSERGWLPLLLVIRSTSLTAGGLFFDPKPWLFAGILVLVLSALIWVPIALGLTRSLWRLRTATSRIAEGDFAVEVPDSERADELGELGRSVQQMAQRLERHVGGQKRFLGDIAHELCSPIARMQASLGILENSVSADEKQKRYLEKVSGELQHMSTLVNELLSFSKASLKREVVLQSVKLAPLIQDTLQREDTDPGAFRVDVSDSIEVRADGEMLGRAIGNLVRNALRYARGSGPIEITAREENSRVLLVIRDHGPGVPEDALQRLFEPFFRPDVARTRESGGVGLGLAIVKSCAEACEGTASVRNCEEGGGLEVTLQLQAARTA